MIQVSLSRMKEKLKLKKFLNHWHLIMFLLFVVYFMHLSPQFLVTYGLSTDFTTLGILGGNHYAVQFGVLLRIIGFILKIFPISILSNSYLFANVLGALTLALIYKMLTDLEELLGFGENSIGFLLKNTLLIGLGTSQFFLMQSLFVERYMLVVFGLVLLVLLLIESQRGKLTFFKKGLLGVVLVFGISYHWLFLWALTLIVVAYLFKRKTISKIVLYKIFTGLISIILASLFIGMLLSNKNPHYYSYEGITSIKTLIASYKNTYLNDGFSSNFSVVKADFSSVMRVILAPFINPLGVVGLIMGLLGFVGAIKRQKIETVFIFIFFIGLFVFPWVLFSGLTNSNQASELYGLLLIVGLFALSFAGSRIFVERMGKALVIIHGRKTVNILLFGLSGIIMVYLLYQKIEMKNLWVDEGNISQNVLSSVVDDSILLCFDDVVCSDLIFLSKVEKIGKNVKIVPYFYNPEEYLVDLNEYDLFEYKNHPYILHGLVASILSSRNNVKLYTMGISQDYYNFLGFDLGFVHYLPNGNYGEIVLTTTEKWPSLNKLDLGNQDFVSGELINEFLRVLVRNRVTNAMTLFRSGKYAEGYIEMNNTSLIAHRMSDDDFNNFLVARNDAEQQVRNQLYINSNIQDNVENIIEEIPLYIESGYYGRAADLARGLLMLQPINQEIRAKVIEVYEEIGLFDLANVERNNLEKLSKLK